MSEKEYYPGTFRMGRCIVNVAIHNDEWHLTISCRTHSPSYKEIKEARYKYLPDEIYMAQVFPPQAELETLHPYSHHLFEIGKNPLQKQPTDAKTKEG